MVWDVRRKITLGGFVIALAAFLGLGVLASRNTEDLIVTRQWVVHTYSVIDTLDKLLFSLKEAESAERGYILTDQKRFMDSYQTALPEIERNKRLLRQLTVDNPDQQSRLDRLELLINHKRDWMAESLRLFKTRGFGASAQRVQLATGKYLMDEILLHGAMLEATERNLLAAREQEARKSTHDTIFIVTWGKYLTLLLFFWVFSLLFSEIAKRRRTEMEVMRLNADLRKHTDDLSAVNKELEAFTYSVSHDLRAPLRHISGFSDLLLKDAANDLNDQGKRYLATIVRSAHQMGQLIDDLLAFSRMGRMELTKTTISLNGLLDEILSDLKTDLENRDIEWTIPSLPSVQADAALMRQVLINLIANALKYTRTRQKTTIELGARLDEKLGTVFFIRDNGVGFDMKYKDKLFGIFQRLHSSDEFEGTGIGLANVRRIVRRHGGQTWAEGIEDQGAVFYFSIPD